MRAVKGWVSGRVQGVWYRKAVQEACRQAGIRGYAKNLDDGRVEVMLVGTDPQREEGKNIVTTGSARSRVADVEWVELAEAPAVEGFETL